MAVSHLTQSLWDVKNKGNYKIASQCKLAGSSGGGGKEVTTHATFKCVLFGAKTTQEKKKKEKEMGDKTEFHKQQKLFSRGKEVFWNIKKKGQENHHLSELLCSLIKKKQPCKVTETQKDKSHNI